MKNIQSFYSVLVLLHAFGVSASEFVFTDDLKIIDGKINFSKDFESEMNLKSKDNSYEYTKTSTSSMSAIGLKDKFGEKVYPQIENQKIVNDAFVVEKGSDGQVLKMSYMKFKRDGMGANIYDYQDVFFEGKSIKSSYSCNKDPSGTLKLTCFKLSLEICSDLISFDQAPSLSPSLRMQTFKKMEADERIELRLNQQIKMKKDLLVEKAIPSFIEYQNKNKELIDLNQKKIFTEDELIADRYKINNLELNKVTEENYESYRDSIKQRCNAQFGKEKIEEHFKKFGILQEQNKANTGSLNTSK